MNHELYTVRDYKNEDKAFICATFLRGLYYGNSALSEMNKHQFMEEYKKVIEALITSPKHVIKIAALKEDEDVIIGYSILSSDYFTIDYVFVKSAFRKQGIGRALVPQYPKYVTHLTALGKALLPKFPDCSYNPFKL